jgi:formamidopyrimidine-DNA glycosylase
VVLSFCDTRRFGEMWTADDWRRDPAIRALGPEPDDADAGAWGRDLRRSAARVHAALLDQRRLAGIGNIYATEALFRAGLRPTLRGRRIPAERVPVLLREIREVLRDGVENRGVSFRDYRDARGQRGRARERLLVYGKEGRPCPRCRSVLKGARVNGRGTVYCPQCQP